MGRGGGFGELGAAGIPQQRGRASPLSHPFEIQVQGHEPREGWQRGPAPGQTGSHRAGRRSSSPCPAPSHPSSPHLARAYKSQAAYPQWSDGSPARQEPHRTASASAGRGPPRRGPSAPLYTGHYQSLLFMITPPRSQAVPPLGPAQVHTSPWQQWQDHLTQCERATGQVLPIWDDGETFWEHARAQFSHLLVFHRLVSAPDDLPSDRPLAPGSTVPIALRFLTFHTSSPVQCPPPPLFMHKEISTLKDS